MADPESHKLISAPRHHIRGRHATKAFRSLLSSCFFAITTLLLNANSCFAQGVENAFQWWQPVYLEAPVVNPKIRAYLESNSRLNDGLNGINQYILRSALGYRPRKNIALFQGYALQKTFVPSEITENRIYQELGIAKVLFNRVDVLYRMRTEERFFKQIDGCSTRMRNMIRLAVPLRNTRFYFVTYDELFVNLNTIEGGPRAGIDQNRFYTALGRQINNKLRFEIGYQYQHINRNDPLADKAAHQLMTQTYINF